MCKNYTVIRSRRRTLAIEITKDGKILVRAPHRVTEGEIEALVAEKKGWIDKHLHRLPPLPAEPSEEELKTLRRVAKEVIPPRVAYYAAVMGLTPASVKITSAARRFGSCSSRGGLCFSCRLAAYPIEAIDYVVVHELAHLKHLDHSPAFHALVERYLPNSRARRELLKRPPVAWSLNL